MARHFIYWIGLILQQRLFHFMRGFLARHFIPCRRSLALHASTYHTAMMSLPPTPRRFGERRFRDRRARA